MAGTNHCIANLQCDGPLLCGFNVAIKWLRHRRKAGTLHDHSVLLFVYANYAN